MRKRKSSGMTKYVLGGIIIFVMVTSVFGVIFYGYADSQQKIEYNGYTFTPLQYSFRSVIDGKPYEFTYEPNQLTSIPLPADISGRLKSSPELSITYNYSSDAAQEIALAIFQMQQELEGAKYIRDGSIAENGFGKPVITCADATASVPVILFTLGEETQFRREGNCIVAEAMRIQEVPALKDMMMFSILGVME